MTYARYNDVIYRYGVTTRYYGLPPANDTQIHWGIEVDWAGTGFTGANEAQYANDLEVGRGRSDYIKFSIDGNANGFEPVRVGTATVILDNSSRRYDPYNTSSVLYPNVLPGKYIKITTTYNGTTYNVFYGKIKSVIPKDDGDMHEVRLECEDGMRLLQSADATVSIQSNIDLDNAIGLVLDDIAYPTRYGRNLEDSADVLNYWWAENKAAGEVQTLADADLGNFFIANNGAATFYSRHHSAAPILTITSADILKKIFVPVPWEVIRNYVKILAHPLTLQTLGALWQLQDTPSIAVGGTLEVWATYQYNSISAPATAVVSPAITTDYLMNTQADGLGSNLSASFAVSFTDFGNTGKITLVNNSAFLGYVTLLKVRGQAITSLYPSTLITENTTSQAAYGIASLTLDNKWIQNTTQAKDFSTWLISFLATPQKFLSIEIEARPDIQFTPELFDVINTTISKLGIAQNFRVGNIEHNWISNNGQATRTKIQLEPFADTSGYWIFNITTGNVTIGVNTVFGL